ncbi:MAG: hypothetical protein K2L12_08210 [Clostridia bacterium]|nr:hypothetical protein [Clostridia bacterium]
MNLDNNKEWEKQFGNKTVAKDFEEREMHKGDYRNENSAYGWDFDHIQPIARNGSDTLNNIQITNIKTNREKADKTTFISENGKTYQVKRRAKTPKSEWAGGYDYSNKKYCIRELKN